MAVAPNETGWLDCSRAFGEARTDEGEYSADWLTTLEGILARRGVAPSEEIAALAAAWTRAAEAVPHGLPITFGTDPEARRRSGNPTA